jgi:hypothetical protein
MSSLDQDVEGPAWWRGALRDASTYDYPLREETTDERSRPEFMHRVSASRRFLLPGWWRR